VLRHHDALRLQFKRVDGEWRQTNGGMPGEIPFEHVDLSALDEPERGEALREHILRLQASLNIGRGPLIRVAYFDFGPQTQGRLLTIVHHLAVDRVSWRVLLEDLGAAYEQVSQGLTPQLPVKTTSFREWSLRLAEYAQLPEVTAEADWWLRLEREPIPPLLPDYPEGSNTEDDVRTTAVFLDEGDTESLVQKVGKAYGTEVHEVLLTSLALALQRWTGQTRALVEMEGFGRQAELVSQATGVEMNLARTVGWFTSVHPLLLRLPPEMPGQNGLGRALMAVKEEVREAPNGGTGFGLLRYLNRDSHIAAAMRRVPSPQISFNYLGQFIQDTAQAAIGSAAFGPAPENSGPDHAAGNERRYLLDVTASVFAGKLRVEFSYSDAQFAEETIETFGALYLEALGSLIEHCLSPEAGGYTKSDFADSGLDEEGVQDLLAELGELDE
jgi:microcystin synthetase protein McyA